MVARRRITDASSLGNTMWPSRSAPTSWPGVRRMCASNASAAHASRPDRAKLQISACSACCWRRPRIEPPRRQCCEPPGRPAMETGPRSRPGREGPLGRRLRGGHPDSSACRRRLPFDGHRHVHAMDVSRGAQSRDTPGQICLCTQDLGMGAGLRRRGCLEPDLRQIKAWRTPFLNCVWQRTERGRPGRHGSSVPTTFRG